MAPVHAAATSPSVLVDARALHGSGIGRYLREVLSRLIGDRRFGEITLLGDVDEIGAFLSARGATSPRIRVLPLHARFYSPRMQLEWVAHRVRAGLRADVTFFPHYDAPMLAFPGRSVVTIHDLIHFRVPNAFPAWRRLPASVVFRHAVRKATRVITVSEFTRRDLVEWIPSAAGKTEVVMNGVAPARPATGSAGNGAAESVAQLRPFVLCVGNRKPHKNLSAAVEALARLRGDDPALRLVVAGPAAPEWERVMELAGRLGVRDAVVDRGEVGDEELAALYRQCDVLLFPSLYEGFGLPVVEAMAHGAPVVASDRASVPEVVGGAGLLVDPESPEAIADAVRRVRRDEGLRDELVARGAARAGELTWDESAARTLDVIHATAAGERGGKG